MKVIRGWDPRDGPKPYSEEWWARLDCRNALTAAGRSTREPKREAR